MISTSPLPIIPTDLLLNIFESFLPESNYNNFLFNDKVNSNLFRLSQVNQYFRSLTLHLIWKRTKNNFMLTTTLSIQFSQNPSLMNFIEELCIASEGEDLNAKEGDMPYHLDLILPLFNNLKRLRIYTPEDDVIRSALATAIQCKSLKTLETLEIMDCIEVTISGFCINSSHYPNLTRLYLKGTIESFITMGELPLLKHLSLGDCSPISSLEDTFLSALPVLETLDISLINQSEDFTSEFELLQSWIKIQNLKGNPPVLRSLTLRNFNFETVTSRVLSILALNSFSSLTSLRTLCLHTINTPFDWDIEAIDSLDLVNITRVELEPAGNIRSVSSLTNFIKSFPNLIHYTIKNWSEISCKKIYEIGSLHLILEDPILNSFLHVIKLSNLLELKLIWKEDGYVLYRRDHREQELIGSLFTFSRMN